MKVISYGTDNENKESFTLCMYNKINYYTSF